jgi:rieske iron-sulfur protein
MKNIPRTACTNATPETVSSPDRREALKATSALLFCAGMGFARQALANDEANSHPKVGDQLARADDEGRPTAMRSAEILPNTKPVAAFPLDPASGAMRDGSRLNKVILIRVDPQELSPDVQPYAAGGVLAYSSVCTHQGCEISEWVPKDQTLMCYCHFSKFSPGRAGEVMAGPAPRTLPLLPLKEVDGVLFVAGPFTARPGVAKSA